MKSHELIGLLHRQTNEIVAKVELLKSFDESYLTRKENSETWSVLECLEHLNLYGDFYLPKIEAAIKQSKTKHDLYFHSGILGGYFSRSMLPKENLNKMKTFKDKNPIYAQLDKSVIERFLIQQSVLLELLEKSKYISLNKVRIPISIARFIKLKLGDVFQFVVNHNLKHLKQIEKIKKNMVNN